MLTAPLEYENENYIIKVYDGFVFDGASIPEFLWTIIGCPFGGLYTSSACLHDALYATHLFDKETSDSIFKEAMLANGVIDRLAEQMYIGVKTFGDKAYSNKYELQKNRDLVEIKIKDLDGRV